MIVVNIVSTVFIEPMELGKRSLGSETIAAEFEIRFATDVSEDKLVEMMADYISQPEIIALKRMKKTKRLEETNIKGKIREISISKPDQAVIRCVLDQGSASNLSPEPLIQSFMKYTSLDIPRWEVDVKRTRLIFTDRIQFQQLSDKMLLLPRNFGTTADNEISIMADSVQDIERLSKIAIAFAMEHDASAKRARNFGLVIEELSIFFAEHGFKDGLPHYINARLVAKDDDLIVRMRDDCQLLSLKEYYQLVKESQDKKDDEMNFSIIFKMSKDVEYTATFGANTLILKI